VSDKLCRSSADKSDNPESANECEAGLPVTDCQPLLLSQSGKFIPKFLAKKRAGDCALKLERAAAKLTESANCTDPLSKTEVGLDCPFTGGDVSVADEVQDNGRSDCLMAAEDPICDDDKSGPVECTTVSLAGQRDASNGEQIVLADNDSSSGSVDQRLPVAVASEAEETRVIAAVNDSERGSCDAANDNTQSGGVSDELQRGITAAGCDQQDGIVPTKPISSAASSDRPTGGPGDTATAPVSREGRVQPEVADTAGDEISQCPVETDVVTDAGSQAGGGPRDDDTDAAAAAVVGPGVNAEDDSGRISSEAAVEMYREVSRAAVISDVEPGRDDDRPPTTHKYDVGRTSEAGVSESVAGDQSRPPPRPADDDAAETAGNDVSRVRDTDQFTRSTASSTEAATTLFDDMLDLTDSQLCQLDDLSRSTTHSVQ